MWYKLFSQLVGQILLWISEPNICDWVRHLNQLTGKWEITPGAVLNTENQKSGKGGQCSSVWERRHPMNTDSEIIALPKFLSPTFAWGYGAVLTEVIGHLSIGLGGLRTRPGLGRLSSSWMWYKRKQDLSYLPNKGHIKRPGAWSSNPISLALVEVFSQSGCKSQRLRFLIKQM